MLKGSYVALVTPFKNNQVDFNSLEKLIEYHLKNKTDGILFCGTTAEAPTYSTEERKKILEFGMKKINKKIPVMIGSGTNNLEKTIKLTNEAKELGADYALVITPYYNKPTQNGLYHYFKEIVNNTDIPIVIYNVPGRTGVNISAETTIKLAQEFDQIVGIKEASGDLVQLSKIVRDAPEKFSCMSGEDALNYPILASGGKGVVSVTANILPEKLHLLSKNVEEGNHSAAKKLHLELLDINEKLFVETNPIPVKYALNKMGFMKEDMRLPLYELSPENKPIIDEILKKYKLINE